MPTRHAYNRAPGPPATPRNTMRASRGPTLHHSRLYPGFSAARCRPLAARAVHSHARMPIDLDHLLRLRLAVARFGEMDASQWWNTKGVLGRLGAMAWPRNFPRTHPFARARAVFTVARARCDEVFNPPGCVTLWKLPTEIEDAFETAWQGWLDEPEPWTPFFDRITAPPPGELIPWLTELGLTESGRERFGSLRRSPEGRGVLLSGIGEIDATAVTLLAAGFGRGAARDLVVPYARVDA